MTFDASGTLFATVYQTPPATVKFNSVGVGSVFATAGLVGPDGLAFDSAGDLFVANQSSR